jgi:hypothetical protein
MKKQVVTTRAKPETVCSTELAVPTRARSVTPKNRPSGALIQSNTNNPANAALLRAVQKKDLRAVCRALDQGASPNTRNGHGVPCFFAAAKRECWPILSVLITAGAQVDYLGKWGWKNCTKTVLHLAAFYGRADIIAQILDGKKMDVNASCGFGRTALHEAAAGNSYPAVKALLDHGANPLLVSDPSCPDGPAYLPIKAIDKGRPGAHDVKLELSWAMRLRLGEAA